MIRSIAFGLDVTITTTPTPMRKAVRCLALNFPFKK